MGSNGGGHEARSLSPSSRREWRGKVVSQLKEHDMQCPMVWTTSTSIYQNLSTEKLDDLVTLAPSFWDRIVRQLVQVAWLTYTNSQFATLSDAKGILGRCHSSVKTALTLDKGCCPILQEYSDGLLHVLYATFVAAECIFEGTNVSDSPVTKRVTKYCELHSQHEAAISAIRGQFMLTCYLARSGHVSRQQIPYADAMLAASGAKEKCPLEGQWKSLYGDLLPDDNTRKLTLLQRGYLARRTPLTTLALAKYMYRLNKLDLAFELCSQAVLEWPESPYAAQAYVCLYLMCPEEYPARRLLSRTFAERCLVRLLQLEPRCLFSVGLAHELLGVRARLDPALVPRALVLYDPNGSAPWSLPQPERPADTPLHLDTCNCVCSSRCCQLTYRAHGTLLTPEDLPHTCYDE